MKFIGFGLLMIFVHTVCAQQISLDIESEPGDVVGQGQTYSYTETDGNFYLSKNQSQGIQWINLDFVQNEQLVFSMQFGPRRGRNFIIGPYPNTTGMSTAYAQPGLSASFYENPLCDRYFGEFQLLELQLNGTQVTRLAVDFTQRCESIEAPALNGVLRYHSNGEPFPAPPDTDVDSVFDSIDNCIDKVNIDQFDSDQDLLGDACDHIVTEASVLIVSDEDDYIGEGIFRDFSMLDGLFQITKIPNEVIFFHFRNDQDALQIYLAMPFGMPLEVGIYEDVINYSFQEVNEAAMHVNYNDRNCNFTGGFEVFEIIRDSVGEILKLDFGYNLSCDSHVGSFTGRVKFDDLIRDVIFYSGIQ